MGHDVMEHDVTGQDEMGHDVMEQNQKLERVFCLHNQKLINYLFVGIPNLT